MPLTQSEKADHLYDALSILTEVTKDVISTMTSYGPSLIDRVNYLKQFCTIHLQAPRQTGHTSTIFDFIEDEQLDAVYLTSNDTYAQQQKAKFNHEKCFTWRDTNKIDFSGNVDAIFVDPATHACRKAMHCIYDRAAEKLSTLSSPPIIYLIS